MNMAPEVHPEPHKPGTTLPERSRMGRRGFGHYRSAIGMERTEIRPLLTEGGVLVSSEER